MKTAMKASIVTFVLALTLAGGAARAADGNGASEPAAPDTVARAPVVTLAEALRAASSIRPPQRSRLHSLRLLFPMQQIGKGLRRGFPVVKNRVHLIDNRGFYVQPPGAFVGAFRGRDSFRHHLHP